ncbi:hypothetical protein BH23THE1_BH23THE1_13520 [soil metagenome]
MSVTQLSFTLFICKFLLWKIPLEPIGDKAYLRLEKGVAPDKSVEEALENLRTSVDLDKDFLVS